MTRTYSQLMPDGTQVVTSQEAARLLGLSGSHVAKMMRAGDWASVSGPFGPRGESRRMMPLAEVERLAEERGMRLDLESEAMAPEAGRPDERLDVVRDILRRGAEDIESPVRASLWPPRAAALRSARLEQVLRDALAAAGG